eukprot:TRINITY_DN610_c0_g1_i1.p1 TRINITY_DN610_c0_g1~~TRINITY_DN610_c0_g1_i1.p1  ORF type:complete len:1892 (+),score=578.12 TRINITY_DN610_c0_g1_i1:41-5716(+)
MAETVEVDFSSLSLDKKLSHSNWKARSLAIDDILKKFSYLEDGDSGWNQYAPMIKALSNDKMAVVGDKALDAMLVFVERASLSAKVAHEYIPLVLDKSSGGKPAVCSKCTQILMLFVETEQHAAVITECIKNFGQKNAKLAQFSLQAVKEALRAFGHKVINPKPILKELANSFDHTDKKVRDEAAELSLEMYRWIGSSVMTHLEALKPMVKKEIEEKGAALPKEVAQPTRFLRSHKPSDVVAGAAAEAAPVVDPLEFVEAADFLSQLPANWNEQIEDKLWKTRKEALTLVVDLANKPKLAPGSYGDLMGALKKVVAKDGNVAVVIEACRALTNLATGLRKDFMPYSRLVMDAALGRLKEKKNIADTAMAILDAMATGDSVNLVELYETIAANLSAAKTAQHKGMILGWIGRCFKSCTKQMLGTSAKLYGKLIVAQLDDSAGDVREAACATFGEFARLIGERAVLVYIEGLEKSNKVMFDKVKSFFPSAANATTTAAAATAVPAVSTSAPVATPAAVAAADKPDAAPAAPTRKVSAKTEKSSDTAPAPPKRKASAKAGAAASAAPAVPEGPSITPEEADARLAAVVAAGIREQLASKDWKERLAGCDAFMAQVEAMSVEELSDNADLFVRFLLDKTPGYSDVNAQVCAKACSITAFMAKTATKFTASAAGTAITSAFAKLIDAKVKAATSEMLTALCDRVSSQFVFSVLYKNAANHKNPAVITAVLAWMAASFQERGMKNVKVPDLINFLKACLESTNPKVKTTCVEVLVETRKRKGASVRDFLADVKPALLATIDAAFATIEDDTPEAAEAGDEEPLEAPRADISGQITNELMKDLGDANWKLRSGALDKLKEILAAANNRIQPKIGELMPGLKARMSDSNKNLVQTAATIVAQLATAMGKHVDKFVKVIAQSLVDNWCDNKKTVRDAVTAALDALVAEAGFDQFFSYMPGALSVDAPVGRKDALAWLIKYLPTIDPKLHDVHSLIKPVIACLDDKNVEVRQAAVPVLEVVAKFTSVAAVRRGAKDLKEGSQRNIAPYLDALKDDVQTAASAAAAPEPSPRKKEEAATTATAAVKKPGLQRQRTMSNPSVEVGKKPKEAEIPGVVLLSNDKKGAREKYDKKHKWMFEEPRSELIDTLHEQAVVCVNETVLPKMFASDFKKHLEAMQDLINSMQAQPKETFECADVLLKWTTLRLHDGNMATLLKTLELCKALFDVLEKTSQTLTDYEAHAFVPFLVGQVGHNNVPVREKVHAALQQMCLVYSPAKMVPFLVEGLRNKNTRVRAECLEEMTTMLAKHGIDALAPAKHVPIVGTLISQETTVRNPALNFLVAVFEILGADPLWKWLAKIPETSRQHLEQKLVGKTGPVVATAAAAPASTLPRVASRSGRPPVAPVAATEEVAKPAEQTTPVKPVVAPAAAVAAPAVTPKKSSMAAPAAAVATKSFADHVKAVFDHVDISRSEVVQDCYHARALASNSELLDVLKHAATVCDDYADNAAAAHFIAMICRLILYGLSELQSRSVDIESEVVYFVALLPKIYRRLRSLQPATQPKEFSHQINYVFLATRGLLGLMDSKLQQEFNRPAARCWEIVLKASFLFYQDVPRIKSTAGCKPLQVLFQHFTGMTATLEPQKFPPLPQDPALVAGLLIQLFNLSGDQGIVVQYVMMLARVVGPQLVNYLQYVNGDDQQKLGQWISYALNKLGVQDEAVAAPTISEGEAAVAEAAVAPSPVKTASAVESSAVSETSAIPSAEDSAASAEIAVASDDDVGAQFVKLMECTTDTQAFTSFFKSFPTYDPRPTLESLVQRGATNAAWASFVQRKWKPAVTEPVAAAQITALRERLQAFTEKENSEPNVQIAAVVSKPAVVVPTVAVDEDGEINMSKLKARLQAVQQD